MHVLFIILFVVSLILGIATVIKPGTDKKTGQPNKRSDMLIGFGIMAIVFGILMVVTTPHAKIVSNNKPADKPTTTTPTPPAASTKKLSAADLKVQATKTLTDKVNEYDSLYKAESRAAIEPDAGHYKSTFWHYWDDIEHTIKYDTYIKAFNDVSNAYYKASLPQPVVLDTWSTDMQSLWNDIQNYTDSEHNVLADQATGGDTTKDQNNVAAADTKYTSDLAKIKADIAQL